MSGIAGDIDRALTNLMQDFETELPVAWQGMNFTPPSGAGAAWWEPMLFLNGSAYTFLGEDAEPQQGLYQVTLHRLPMGGAYSFDKPANYALAAEIAAHFAKGAKTSFGAARVRVTAHPSVSHPLFDDGRMMIVVTIPWMTF